MDKDHWAKTGKNAFYETSKSDSKSNSGPEKVMSLQKKKTCKNWSTMTYKDWEKIINLIMK